MRLPRGPRRISRRQCRGLLEGKEMERMSQWTNRLQYVPVGLTTLLLAGAGSVLFQKRATCKGIGDVWTELRLLAEQDDGLPGPYPGRWKDIWCYLTTHKLDYFLRDWRLLDGRIGGRGPFREGRIATFPFAKFEGAVKYAVNAVNIYLIWSEKNEETGETISTTWALIGGTILPVKNGRCHTPAVGYFSTLSREIARNTPHTLERTRVCWPAEMIELGIKGEKRGKYLSNQGERRLESVLREKGFYMNSAAERYLAGEEGRWDQVC